jgi:gliding motility-associated-like protein
VEIYNRWGELLFRSEGYKEPWDGLYNGDELPIGTYYYVIDTNEPEFQDKISGPLTILR